MEFPFFFITLIGFQQLDIEMFLVVGIVESGDDKCMLVSTCGKGEVGGR
jgi:hypothetical protein